MSKRISPVMQRIFNEFIEKLSNEILPCKLCTKKCDIIKVYGVELARDLYENHKDLYCEDCNIDINNKQLVKEKEYNERLQKEKERKIIEKLDYIKNELKCDSLKEYVKENQNNFYIDKNKQYRDAKTRYTDPNSKFEFISNDRIVDKKKQIRFVRIDEIEIEFDKEIFEYNVNGHSFNFDDITEINNITTDCRASDPCQHWVTTNFGNHMLYGDQVAKFQLQKGKVDEHFKSYIKQLYPNYNEQFNELNVTFLKAASGNCLESYPCQHLVESNFGYQTLYGNQIAKIQQRLYGNIEYHFKCYEILEFPKERKPEPEQIEQIELEFPKESPKEQESPKESEQIEFPKESPKELEQIEFPKENESSCSSCTESEYEFVLWQNDTNDKEEMNRRLRYIQENERTVSPILEFPSVKIKVQILEEKIKEDKSVKKSSEEMWKDKCENNFGLCAMCDICGGSSISFCNCAKSRFMNRDTFDI